MKSILSYFLIALLFPLLFSCKNEVKENTETAPVDSVAKISEGKELDAKRQKNISSSVVSRAMMTPELSRFVSSAISAGLVDSLMQGGKMYTIFAPTNDAFDAMDSKTKERVYNLANVASLKQLLKNHIVIGNLDSINLVSSIRNHNGNFKINTMGGTQLNASRDGMDIIFTDANGKKSKLVKSDIKAENGILHVIDAVMGE
ncbi:MAG: fasciclin domain-containing protein [Patiriisocius sp.]|uniref:fasciclin domain-containing protein n=1 Tax=Patiriisocius sp. TaxID=2822396 RepID=UPI003EF2A443